MINAAPTSYAGKSKDPLNLLDIVAAVNGVIDFLPTIWKLWGEKQNNNEGCLHFIISHQHIDGALSKCIILINVWISQWRRIAFRVS